MVALVENQVLIDIDSILVVETTTEILGLTWLTVVTSIEAFHGLRGGDRSLPKSRYPPLSGSSFFSLQDSYVNWQEKSK